MNKLCNEVRLWLLENRFEEIKQLPYEVSRFEFNSLKYRYFNGEFYIYFDVNMDTLFVRHINAKQHPEVEQFIFYFHKDNKANLPQTWNVVLDAALEQIHEDNLGISNDNKLTNYSVAKVVLKCKLNEEFDGSYRTYTISPCDIKNYKIGTNDSTHILVGMSNIDDLQILLQNLQLNYMVV